MGLARPEKVLVMTVLKYAPRFFEIYIAFQKMKSSLPYVPEGRSCVWWLAYIPTHVAEVMVC